MMHKWLRRLAVTVIAWIAATAGAEVFYVATEGRDDPSRDGRSPSAAWATLRLPASRCPPATMRSASAPVLSAPPAPPAPAAA